MDNNTMNIQTGGNGQPGGNLNQPLNGQGNGNWQSQPQAMPTSKQPMNPAKKKKLILGITLGVGGVIVAVIAVVVVSMLMRVDYGESYRVAKELKPKVAALNHNYDCSSVVNDVAKTYATATTYDGYIAGCLGAMEGVDGLVAQLGQTPGVKRNQELKAQYERFQEAIGAVLPDEEELKQRLNVYQVWHNFVVAVDDLRISTSSDAEIQNAAKILTESGNEILAKYGAGWLEKTLAYVQAYRAYTNSTVSYFSDEYRALKVDRDNKQTEQKNWIAENKPDIAEVGGLSFGSTAKMYTEFTKLYDMITELYEENYDDSGDCTEFLGEVICD